MALIDYIEPRILREEGYIHITDTDSMIERLGREKWVNLSQMRPISISLHLAAEVIGITQPTLVAYAKLGYIRVNAEGKVSLIDAILFDYRNVKRDALNKKRCQGSARR